MTAFRVTRKFIDAYVAPQRKTGKGGSDVRTGAQSLSSVADEHHPRRNTGESSGGVFVLATVFGFNLDRLELEGEQVVC